MLEREDERDERGGLTPPRRCCWKLNFPALGRADSITLRTWRESIELFERVCREVDEL